MALSRLRSVRLFRRSGVVFVFEVGSFDPVAMLRTLTQPLPKGEEKDAPGSDMVSGRADLTTRSAFLRSILGRLNAPLRAG